MISPRPYRGPRVIARNGQGMGSYVWVVPGEPGPSQDELEQMGESMTTAWHDSMQAESEAQDEAEALLLGALEAAVVADDRPGYGDFYYEPDDDDALDEFADELHLVGSTPGESTAAPSGSVVQVNVLGPVEVVGWHEPPKRRIVVELSCYLALHRGRAVSGDELRSALWPEVDSASEASAKSLRNYMSELRRGLGAEHIPVARGTGYSVAASVSSDWAQFTRLVNSTQLIGADEASALKDALSLVRGRPFSDVSYNWALSELLVSEMEVGVTHAARRLAELSMGAADPSTAAVAARRGLLVSQFDIALWEIALRAGAEMGRDELARTWRDAQATLGDDAGELSDLVASLRGG